MDSNAFDGRTENMANGLSRRALMQRLGALGLVAGGVALQPPRAAATDLAPLLLYWHEGRGDNENGAKSLHGSRVAGGTHAGLTSD